MFQYVPDMLKIKEICEFTVKRDTCISQYVPNKFKTRKMCESVVRENNDIIIYVPDWFVTAEMHEKCKDEEWLRLYKQRKSHKVKVKEEHLPIAWHPDRVINWCFLEDKKQAHQRNWKI